VGGTVRPATDRAIARHTARQRGRAMACGRDLRQGRWTPVLPAPRDRLGGALIEALLHEARDIGQLDGSSPRRWISAGMTPTRAPSARRSVAMSPTVRAATRMIVSSRIIGASSSATTRCTFSPAVYRQRGFAVPSKSSAITSAPRLAQARSSRSRNVVAGSGSAGDAHARDGRRLTCCGSAARCLWHPSASTRYP